METFQWALLALILIFGLATVYFIGVADAYRRRADEEQRELDLLRLDREFQNQPGGNLKQRYLAIVGKNRDLRKERDTEDWRRFLSLTAFRQNS